MTVPVPGDNAYAITPLDPTLVLARIGEDLTVRSHRGVRVNAVARDAELTQIIKVLGRRAKSNPLILGEAGVGKTTLCYALADRIVDGEVPEWLVGRKIIRTSFFEIWGTLGSPDHAFAEYAKTLKQVLKFCSEHPIILFMDEFHLVANHPISANVIKPALADGTLRMIGATTLRDYRAHLERDEALMRRFIPVIVAEPSPAQTRQILAALKPEYEARYRVTLEDRVLDSMVGLSDTYMTNRNQPDKAIDLLELSCIHATFPHPSPGQQVRVSPETVKEVASEVTGIPRDLLLGETDRLTGIVQTLGARYVGQEEALQQIAQRLVVTKSRLNLEAHRPDGVFLVAGPPGVGKTELGRSLARLLSDQADDLIQLDMGLFSDYHALTRLLGDAGAVGPDHVPLLTLHIKNHPSAVLMLEHIERAHADVLKVLQQVFSAGVILDCQGTEVVFDHVTVFMTTRLGFEHDARPIGLNRDRAEGDWALQRAHALEAIEKAFPPEFLRYVDEIVTLKPMTRDMLKAMIVQKVELWAQQLGKRVVFPDAVAEALVDQLPPSDASSYGLIKLADQQLGQLVQALRKERGWEAFTEVSFSVDASSRITARGVVSLP